MNICGCVRRVKGIEICEIQLLRKDGKACCQPVLVVDDVVDTRERVEALALDVSFVEVQVL